MNYNTHKHITNIPTEGKDTVETFKTPLESVKALETTKNEKNTKMSAQDKKIPFLEVYCLCSSRADAIYYRCRSLLISYEYNYLHYDQCFLPREESPPCSARLPDTSANNKPDVLDGLSACFDPDCHRKENKSECLSEGECSWCEFTDKKEQIETPCCRLKEECTFGKTKFTSRLTCAKPPPTLTSGTTDINIAVIVGSTVGCVCVIILIISAVLYFYRHHYPVPDDPYIDAVADMNEISNNIQSERE
ncbi:unnamed protein product [Mytilus edulis]|uniref:Uncharacterized protein n=1 Tax=Mytilus edulis TaxID=6550 RepID=A0A8S3THN7_MYTED|nr:unnamed protein product [Mytilus edulis]